MRTIHYILLWPLIASLRLGLEVLVWFRPSIAWGRRAFPAGIRQLIEQAKTIEVHYAELGFDEPPEPGQIGTPMGFHSLGMVRVESERGKSKGTRTVFE